jgi:hypothetical protein
MNIIWIHLFTRKVVAELKSVHLRPTYLNYMVV